MPALGRDLKVKLYMNSWQVDSVQQQVLPEAEEQKINPHSMLTAAVSLFEINRFTMKVVLFSVTALM